MHMHVLKYKTGIISMLMLSLQTMIRRSNTKWNHKNSLYKNDLPLGKGTDKSIDNSYLIGSVLLWYYDIHYCVCLYNNLMQKVLLEFFDS